MEANEFIFTQDEVENVLEYLQDNTIKCSICGNHRWKVEHEKNLMTNSTDFRISCASPTCTQFLSRQILNLTIQSIEDEIRMEEENKLDGLKFDEGKIRAGILDEFKLALMEIARVGTAGLNKGYARGSWRSVPDAKERYMDAFWRHILATEEINESDGGVYHLAQVAWNAMALLELRLAEKKGGLYVE
jgi:hypothetical protein